MAQHNQNTLTLIGIVQEAVNKGNYAIDQYEEFAALFKGDEPPNVRAEVPGLFHKGKNGARGRPKTIYDVVTQDPNFGVNANGFVRDALKKQTAAASRKPGKTPQQAVAALRGRIVTADKIPVPDSDRRRRGQELIATARAGGRRRG